MIEIENMDVLIVDDAVPMCKSILKMMKILKFGNNFHIAQGGNEGLKILRENPVDLVLLDYNMPGMNGGEVLSQIREDKDLRDIPVVMVTAEAYEDFVSEAGESAVDAYLLKPFTLQLLREKISQVVEKANNPSAMVVHLKKARECEEANDLEGAIKEALLAMEANSNSTRPLRDLGYYYFKNNDHEMAEKYLKMAINKNELDVIAFHHLGELYLKQNDIENAQVHFERAMEISPRHLDRGIKFAKILVQMKMLDRVENVFDHVMKLSGEDDTIKEEFGRFCIAEKAYDYGVKLLRQVIDKSDRKDLYYPVGKALKEKGDIQEAIPYLLEAERVEDHKEDIQIHLAEGYLALEKPIFAERVLKKVLATNPENENAKELLTQCA